MIELTRLNGHRLVVNCDLIKFAEASPDTTITLVNGEKLIVTEGLDALKELILLYRSGILARAWPDALAAFNSSGSIELLHKPHKSALPGDEND